MTFQITRTKRGYRICLSDGKGDLIMVGSRHYTRHNDALRAVRRIQAGVGAA